MRVCLFVCVCVASVSSIGTLKEMVNFDLVCVCVSCAVLILLLVLLQY